MKAKVFHGFFFTLYAFYAVHFVWRSRMVRLTTKNPEQHSRKQETESWGGQNHAERDVGIDSISYDSVLP